MPRSPLVALLSGTVLALVLSASVLAYAGEVVAFLTISGPTGPVPCGTPVTLRATATDAAGAPIEGQRVHWKIDSTPSHKDRIKPRSSITDANGVATTTVTLACVAGPRTVTARADKVRASAVLDIITGGVLGAVSGLPNTSTEVNGAQTFDSPPVRVFAVIAVLAGSGLILRRIALRIR